MEYLPPTCRRVIDLGAGDGRLARAALERCSGAKGLLVEADTQRAAALIAQAVCGEQVLELDVLRDPALLDVRRTFGVADAIISNPPYLEVQLTRTAIDLVRGVFPFLQDASGWMRADIAFLAQAWALSDTGSFLGFILPAPALTQPQYRPLRELLLTQLDGLTVSQLPSRVFARVEVDAFLVTGVRALARERIATLRRLDGDGRVVGEMPVAMAAALERLDYVAHAGAASGQAGGSATCDTLGSLGVEISRGSLTRIAFARAGVDAFHTTHFAAAGTQVRLSAISATYRQAEAGDILIPRVGSRCLTRETRVAGGAGVFSDSVYRLRGDAQVMQRVWKTLSSDFGRQWRAARAVGSCAKFLPLWVLRDMPIL
ncbi:methyltransferase [Paraburkholderia aspalathi]|nr:methyltransferase [Paraburkholderia aspalathi]MBK3780091.1 methyltransferase [Paraburkholderia aspalathi]